MNLQATPVSGTIPKELGNLRSVQQQLWMSHTTISGTLPALNGMHQLRRFELASTHLSGTLTTALGDTGTHVLRLSTTSLSGTIPDFQTSSLHELFVSNTRLSGSVPSFLNTSLQSLDLSSSAITRLPARLPSSLRDVYFSNNPISNTAPELGVLLSTLPGVHTFDVDLMSAAVVMDYTENRLLCRNFTRDQLLRYGAVRYCSGARIAPPVSCTVGGTCEFRIYILDSDDSPVRVGHTVHNLTLRLNGSSLSSSMVDMDDGSFIAAVPTEWIDHSGPHLFQFFHLEKEFKPHISGNEIDKGFRPAECKDPMLTQLGTSGGGDCEVLRTVNFLPRLCPGANTVADPATGSQCQCKPGFIPYTGQNETVLSCHVLCQGEGVPSHDGSRCECPGTTYDSDATGVIICVGNSWSKSDAASFRDAQNRRARGELCFQCPSCATCEAGIVTLNSGWRLNATTTQGLKRLIEDGKDGRLQTALRCPSTAYDDVLACPSLRLHATTTANQTCSSNHTGQLCTMCEPGYSLQASDNRCVVCRDLSGIKDHFGVSVTVFIVASVGILLVFIGIVYCHWTAIKEAKASVFPSVRIVLGLLQVLALLADVLNIVYPAPATHVLNYAGLLTGDVRSLVQFDCMGWAWQDKWMLTVVWIPLAAFLGIGLRSCYHFSTRNGNAHQKAASALFFVVMLLYPQLSERIFSALRCRSLGPGLEVLEVDYAIDCQDRNYRQYSLFAMILVVLWPIGIPLGLMALLLWEWRRSRKQWYELCLSGLLQFYKPGTAAQIVLGCALAFGWFGLQQRLQPYRETEANMIKTLVDIHIFLSFLFSLIIRVLPRVVHFEP